MQKIIFLIFISLLSCNSQKKEHNKSIQSEKTESKTVEKISGEEIISELEKLEFFNLTDATELETTKQEFTISKNKWNLFSGTMRGETTDFTDNRFFAVDCENLFETEGLTDYLDKVKPSIELLGLKLDYSNEKSEQTESHWKHTIQLNGTEYKAFDGKFTDNDWGFAYVNFIQMLNKELEEQGSKNRFYPIKCQNDGIMVLLTFKQFDFIKKHYPNNNEHPKTISEWKQINKL